MGVEYAHYLLAADPNWIGDINTARRVHDVLSRWQLVVTQPELFEVQGGQTKKLRGRLTTLKNPPANLLVRYSSVSGVPAIDEIVGPSHYECVGDR